MTKIIQRHDTAANWESVNPVLAVGEIGIETDTNKMKIGDGTSPYTKLPYIIQAQDPLSINTGYFQVTPSNDYLAPQTIEKGYIAAKYNHYPFRTDSNDTTSEIISVKLRMKYASTDMSDNNTLLLFFANPNNENYNNVQLHFHSQSKIFSAVCWTSETTAVHPFFKQGSLTNMSVGKDYDIYFTVQIYNNSYVKAIVKVVDAISGSILLNWDSAQFDNVTPQQMNNMFGSGIVVKAGSLGLPLVIAPAYSPCVYPNSVKVITGFGVPSARTPIFDTSNNVITLNYDNDTLKVNGENKLYANLSNTLGIPDYTATPLSVYDNTNFTTPYNGFLQGIIGCGQNAGSSYIDFLNSNGTLIKTFAYGYSSADVNQYSIALLVSKGITIKIRPTGSSYVWLNGAQVTGQLSFYPSKGAN